METEDIFIEHSHPLTGGYRCNLGMGSIRIFNCRVGGKTYRVHLPSCQYSQSPKKSAVYHLGKKLKRKFERLAVPYRLPEKYHYREDTPQNDFLIKSLIEKFEIFPNETGVVYYDLTSFLKWLGPSVCEICQKTGKFPVCLTWRDLWTIDPDTNLAENKYMRYIVCTPCIPKLKKILFSKLPEKSKKRLKAAIKEREPQKWLNESKRLLREARRLLKRR